MRLQNRVSTKDHCSRRFTHILVAVAALLVSTAQVAHAQSPWRDVYADYADSVVMIRMDIKLESRFVSNLELFQRWERSLDEPILNEYLPISSGSGFFFSDSGHILTNHHVVEVDDPQETRQFIYDAIRFYVMNDLSESGLNQDSLRAVVEDFRLMTANAPITVNVVTRDDEAHPADIMFSDEEKDLAVVRVELDEPTKPIPFAYESNLYVGDPVAAIGYPLADLFEYLFEDLEPTLTTGIISAIRDDVWGLQTTAAANPGSSGGPLIDESGRVQGVVVGKIEFASQLQFALSSEDVVRFLKYWHGRDFLEANEEAAIALGQNYEPGPDGILNSGGEIILDTLEGMTVYLDGEEVGTTPMSLTPESGVHQLGVLNEFYEHNQQIRVDAENPIPLVYRPRLERQTGSLVVRTDPPGVDVWLNDQFLGKSPLSESDIVTDEYELSFVADNYVHPPVPIVVNRNEATDLTVELERAYTVTLLALPEFATYWVRRGDEELEFAGEPSFRIAAGAWEIRVSHRYMEDGWIDLPVDGDTQLDLSGHLREGRVHLQDLRPESSVFVDDSHTALPGSRATITLPAGSHKIVVRTPNHMDIPLDVVVDPEEMALLPLTYIWTEEFRRARARRRLPVPLGIGLIAAGAVLNLDAVAVPASFGSYIGYTTIKVGSLLAIAGGIGLEVYAILRNARE